MNNTQQIDKVFKNKLKDFQQSPPKGAWEKVSAGIVGATGVATKLSLLATIFANKIFRYGIIIGVGAIIVAFLIGVLNNSNTESKVFENEKTSFVPKKSTKEEVIISKKEIKEFENSNKAVEQKVIPSKSKQTTSNVVDENDYMKTEKRVDEDAITYSDNSTVKSFDVVEKEVFQSDLEEKNTLAVNNNVPEPKPEINTVLIEIPNISVQTKEPIVSNINQEKVNIQNEENNTEPIVQQNNPKQDPPTTEEVIVNSNPPLQSKPLSPVDRTESPWSLGGYLTRDFIFNSADSKSEIKNNYSFDVQTSYKHKNYVFQTGLGFDLSEDNWDYIIKYKRNEALGTYDNVDSVYFTTVIDSFGNVTVVPHFITSKETVYDSINHSLADQSSNHYYYMHIPLIAGYKLKDFKNWKVMVKGGAMYSILIHKKEPTINYYDAGVRVTSIDDKKLIRVKTNWHLLLGFEFEYMISERLSLSCEPIIKYYVKSIYNSNNLTLKQPYSAGLKAGLIYNFK